MSNSLSSQSTPSSDYDFLPNSIWETSPIPAFRINSDQKIVAGNSALESAITNPMAFYPGKSLMTWLGYTNTEIFNEWCEAFLNRESVGSLTLSIQDVSFPLVLIEVFPVGQDLVIRAIPFQQEETTQIQPEETVTFFKELRASISHDLRAPIRQLRLYTQKILAYSKAEIPKELQEEMAFLNDSSGKLLIRFESLALLIENESRTIELNPVDLSQLVKLASGAFSLHLNNTNGKINCGPLPVVLADQGLLFGIVMEFLNNAVDHIPTDRTPGISISSQESEAGVIILVQDNGIGFDNCFSHKVFCAYSSIHHAPLSKKYPAGMGLTIAKRAAERMGMALTASGIKDQGATFCLEIPKHLILT